VTYGKITRPMTWSKMPSKISDEYKKFVALAEVAKARRAGCRRRPIYAPGQLKERRRNALPPRVDVGGTKYETRKEEP
jgi:hypothetical protein